jgi:hypothetical protein
MAEQFMTHNVIRLTTRGGLEGVAAAASYTDRDFDRSASAGLTSSASRRRVPKR